MNDLLVHRGADAARKARVALERRHAASGAYLRFNELVDFQRGDARARQGTCPAQHHGGNATRLFHGLDLLW